MLKENETHGRYRVTGSRIYRGHLPGSDFIARLDRNAEGRAVRRGDIELLERFIPSIEPGSFSLPEDWLLSPNTQANRPAKAGLSIEGSK